MYPDPFPEELAALLQPGGRVRLTEPRKWNKLSDSPLLHILAVVDDSYIVYKTWGEHKRQWLYGIEWSYWFWLLWKDGDLEPGS